MTINEYEKLLKRIQGNLTETKKGSEKRFELPIVDATLAIETVDFIARMESIIIVAILVSLIPSFMVTRIKLLDAIWGK